MSILIKNGTVYDGTGAPPQKMDILIREARIVRCGTLSKDSAETLLDATGAIVAPGCIDTVSGEGVHGGFDPDADTKLLEKGVTTILGGVSGISSVPFSSRTGSLMREWSAERRWNVHWNSVREFLRVLERRPHTLNFGTFVGLGTLRSACGVPYGNDMTFRELESATALLRRSLAEGAFGLSAHLSMPHSETIAFHELVRLFKVVAEKKGTGILEARFPDKGAIPALEEFFDLARSSHARVVLHNAQSLFGGNDKEEALAFLERETANLDAYFDTVPFPSLRLPLTAFLPRWLREGNRAAMEAAMRERHGKERLLAHFKNTMKGKGEKLVIADVPPPLSFLRGTTLAAFAEHHGVSLQRALYLFMRLTRFRAHLLVPQPHTRIFEALLANPHGIVTGDFKALLARAADDERVPLEKWIRKMTGLPAEKFRIPKRGVLKEGNFADIVVLRDAKPETVIVNGVQTVRDGVSLHGRYAGRVLAREAQSGNIQ